jgi:hypothetical protein
VGADTSYCFDILNRVQDDGAKDRRVQDDRIGVGEVRVTLLRAGPFDDVDSWFTYALEA